MEVNWILIFLAFVTCTALATILYFRWYRPEEKRIATYPLYKVRDDIIYQLVSGNIDEESMMVTFLYDNVNKALLYRDRINLINLTQAIIESDPDIDRKVRKLFEELSQSPPEMVKIADEYFHGFANILFTNSISIKIVLFVNKVTIKPVQGFLRALVRVFRRISRTYIDNATRSYNAYKKFGEYGTQTRKLCLIR